MSNSDKISEKKYKKIAKEMEIILDNIPGLVFYKDDKNNLIRVNKYFADSHKLNKKLIEGKSCFDLYSKEQAQAYWDDDLEVINSGKPKLNIVEPWETEDGTRWLNTNKIPMFNEKGKCTGIIGFSTEVTEQVKAKAEIHKLSAYNRNLIEVSLDPLATIDQDGKIMDVNFATETIIGHSREELIGTEFSSYFTEPEKATEGYKKVFETGSVQDYELGLQHVDGHVTPVLYNASIFKDENGKVMGVFAAARDITKRKLIEKKLKDYSRNLENIVEQRTLRLQKKMEENQLYLDIAGVMLLVLNADGTVKRINKKGCEILGYAEEQIIGKNWINNFIPKEKQKEIKSVFRRIMVGEIDLLKYYENPILTKEGKIKLIAWHNTILKDEKGNIVGILSSGEDITERKKAEKKLEESEKKYRTLFENAQEGIWTIDENSITSFVNPRMAEMLGYTQDEMIGKHLFDFMDEKGVAIANRNLERRKQGIEEQHDFEFLRKNGTRIYTILETSPLMDEEGNYKGAVAFVSDITERKKVEYSLLRKTNDLKERIKELTCLYNLSELVGNIDLSLEQIFQETVKILKSAFKFPEKTCSRIMFNQKEFITENFAETEFMLKKNINVNRKIVGRIEVGYLEEIKDYDGIIFLQEERDMITSVSEILAMTIKRKNIEEELQLERDNLFNVLSSMEDGVYIVDQNYDIEYVNPSSVKEFGQYEGKKCYEYLHSRQDVCPWCKNQEVFKGKTVRWELYSIRNQKTYDNIDTPLKNIYGSTSKLKISRDITKFKKAEQDLLSSLVNLKRTNIELERFAYVASHDLQEPLRMIVSFIQLLEKRYKDKLDEDADDFIAYIVDGAKRMQTLINDLLLFSRIGRSDIQFKLIDINAVIDSVINNLKKSIEETNATITHDPLPTIVANEGEFTQLLQNLISNSLKFHKEEEPPVVHISAKLQKNQWTFSVRDDGIGINSQYFDRIFIIFQRLHKKDEFGGTGIGLAICKKIIERHSGKIWVESELGKGSTFYFSIPKTEVKK